jgi:hypothetical protein
VVVADVLQRGGDGLDEVGGLDGRGHGFEEVKQGLGDYPTPAEQDLQTPRPH